MNCANCDINIDLGPREHLKITKPSDWDGEMETIEYDFCSKDCQYEWLGRGGKAIPEVAKRRFKAVFTTVLPDGLTS